MFTVGKSPNFSGKTKENRKLNNGGCNKWLEILAGKDLQTKLRKSEDVDFKFSASNGTKKANTRSRVTEHLLMWLLAFLAPATRKFFVLPRNSDHDLAIQSAGKFFIYEYYELYSPEYP